MFGDVEPGAHNDLVLASKWEIDHTGVATHLG